MTDLLIWLGKSILILGFLNFVVLPVCNAITKNSWVKLPLMIFLSIPSAAFIAWLQYVPYLLFVIWVALNHYTLQYMVAGDFEKEAGYKLIRPLFWISSYTYICLTCSLAIFLQMKVGNEDRWVPLWRFLFGFW